MSKMPKSAIVKFVFTEKDTKFTRSGRLAYLSDKDRDRIYKILLRAISSYNKKYDKSHEKKKA